MKKNYLDTNILVAAFSDADSDKENKKLVEQVFDTFSQLKDVELWSSMWAITEMVKALIANQKMKAGDAALVERDFVNEARLYGLKIRFADVSPDSDYDFKEFFFHIRQAILLNNSGVGDTIHSVIMKNNSISHILTFDVSDYATIPNLTVMDPKNIKF